METGGKPPPSKVASGPPETAAATKRTALKIHRYNELQKSSTTHWAEMGAAVLRPYEEVAAAVSVRIVSFWGSWGLL